MAFSGLICLLELEVTENQYLGLIFVCGKNVTLYVKLRTARGVNNLTITICFSTALKHNLEV